jgi:hypothetical protein
MRGSQAPLASTLHADRFAIEPGLDAITNTSTDQETVMRFPIVAATVAALASLTTLAGPIGAGLARADNDNDSASDAADEPTPAEKAKADYARAVAFRNAALDSAIAKLNEMLPREAGPPAPALQLQIVKQWLKVEPRDKRFSEVVSKARRQLMASKAATSRVTVVLPPDSFTACTYNDKGDDDPYAFHFRKQHRILLCKPWMTAGAGCQRIAVIHEYLHEVGSRDVDELKTPDEALDDADTLALLASQLHREATESDHCPGDPAVKLPSVEQILPQP